MDTPLAIWQAHLKALRNAGHRASRMRVALGVVLVFNVITGLWSANQLLLRVHQWQLLGSAAVDMGLWSLCLLTWSGMSFFAVLVSIRLAFSNDEAQLLMSLPISSSSHLRTLYGLFFIENLWNWLLLEVGVTGYVLISTLGTYAVIWLIVLQLGVGVVVLCTLVATLVVIRYPIPHERVKIRIWTAIGVAVTLLLVPGLELTVKVSIDMQVLLLWCRPEYFIGLFALLLAVALGPLAAAIGKLYMVAFQTTQGWDRSHKALTIPGLHILISVFSRRRTLAGALWVKSLLSQSRNVIFWARITLVLIGVALFPQVQAVLVRYGFSNTTLAAGYAAGLAILHILEVAPNAISGEGNRLTLYLTAPFDLSRILRAKLILFLLPVLSESILIGLFLSWRLGLTPGQVGFAIAVIILIVLGNVTLLVMGSVWDEDLDLAVEGAIQAVLQEEAPISPRRMWLLNMSILLFVLMLLLLWKAPALLALAGLIVVDGGILVGMWRFSCTQLCRLIQDVSNRHQPKA